MGTKFSGVSVIGYLASPPSDDGSMVAANQVKFNTVKTKVGDPLNNFCVAVNTALLTTLDLSMSTTAVTYTTTAADHLKPVRITAAATVHLGDAATMAVGYQTAVVNAYSAAITVDLATAGNKLNTIVGGSISLQPGNAIIVAVNQAGDGYDILGHSFFDDTTPAPKIAGATVNFNAEASLASAATVNIGAATSNNILITGTTTITAFDTVAAGITRTVRFNGVLTLTYNGTSLILPGAANITTTANDCAELESLGSGNWICRAYHKTDGTAVVRSGRQLFTNSGSFTIPATTLYVTGCAGGGGGGGSSGAVFGAGGGGGGGRCDRYQLTGLTIGATITVTIGAAGTAGGNGVNGGGGGNTTLTGGATLTLNGGGGGLTAGGAGAGGSGPYSAGFPGAAGNGGSNLGGGGGGSYEAGGVETTTTSGGRGPLGTGGNGGNNASGSAATGFGCGGGGGGGNQSGGGAGTGGFILFEW